MILFPNCKINLGLRILRKRDDGYHDLETVFYPLAIKDVLGDQPQSRTGLHGLRHPDTRRSPEQSVRKGLANPEKGLPYPPLRPHPSL
ncbi:hypothetical protein ACQ86N_23850 [Puia sp. P3]|uniref:hypothetical protein n=1 Tax=Puia sp. P3 TaxID=3423952 RepID=UPI003D6672D8